MRKTTNSNCKELYIEARPPNPLGLKLSLLSCLRCSPLRRPLPHRCKGLTLRFSLVLFDSGHKLVNSFGIGQVPSIALLFNKIPPGCELPLEHEHLLEALLHDTIQGENLAG